MLLAHCPVDCGNWDPNSNFLQQETWASLIWHEGWMKGGQFLRKNRSCSVKIYQGRWGEAQVVWIVTCYLAQARSDVFRLHCTKTSGKSFGICQGTFPSLSSSLVSVSSAQRFLRALSHTEFSTSPSGSAASSTSMGSMAFSTTGSTLSKLCAWTLQWESNESDCGAQK